MQLLQGDLEVRYGELMILVPAEWTIVTSLEQDGMEHGQSECYLSEVAQGLLGHPLDEVRVGEIALGRQLVAIEEFVV